MGTWGHGQGRGSGGGNSSLALRTILAAAQRTLGRWKVTEVRILVAFTPLVPLRAAFFAALALTSWGLVETLDDILNVYSRGRGRRGEGEGGRREKNWS